MINYKDSTNQDYTQGSTAFYAQANKQASLKG